MNRSQTQHTDPSNAGQAEAWDGDEGAHWARNADRYEAAVARYDDALFDAAAIGHDAAVLDVGCGTGSTTRESARLAREGRALGVDLSSAMLAVARQRADREHLTNIDFLQADAQIHPFGDGAFDVVLSRTAAMFFGDPVAALTNLGRALRPDGRMVLLVWQGLEANEWIQVISTSLAAGREPRTPPPGAPGPFALSEPERVREVFAGTGLADPDVTSLSEHMCLGPDAGEAFELILGQAAWMLDGLDDAGVRRARAALLDAMRAHETDDGVLFGSSAWLITGRRAG